MYMTSSIVNNGSICADVLCSSMFSEDCSHYMGSTALSSLQASRLKVGLPPFTTEIVEGTV